MFSLLRVFCHVKKFFPHDRRGAACTKGPPTCTTKDFRPRARMHVREAITTDLLGLSVAIERSSIVTELALPVS